MPTNRKTPGTHVKAYRSRMKQRGLRQVNLWLPDTRSPEFRRECRRQSLLVAAPEQAQPIDTLLETAAGAVEGWT